MSVISAKGFEMMNIFERLLKESGKVSLRRWHFNRDMNKVRKCTPQFSGGNHPKQEGQVVQNPWGQRSGKASVPHDEKVRGSSRRWTLRYLGQIMWWLLHFIPKVMEEHWRIWTGQLLWKDPSGKESRLYRYGLKRGSRHHLDPNEGGCWLRRGSK